MSIQEQFEKIPKDQLPKHIALIPNGNRTWAKQKGMTPEEGHNIGVEKLIEFARAMRNWGIHTASVWGSSTDNYKSRPKGEMANLNRLLEYVLDTTAQEALDDGARLIHIGDKDILPNKAVKKIKEWEDKTKDNIKHVINIAFAYGGQDEILRAFKKVYRDLKDGKIKLEDLFKIVGKYHGKYPYFAFKDYLDTADQPHPFPDLIIRTAGEQRLSGFLTWQSVYSEFHYNDKLLPDMTLDDFRLAIIDYTKRNRKFGGDNE